MAITKRMCNFTAVKTRRVCCLGLSLSFLISSTLPLTASAAATKTAAHSTARSAKKTTTVPAKSASASAAKSSTTSSTASAGQSVSADSASAGILATPKRLDDFEEIIYGSPRKYLTMDARLKELESKIFGAEQKGTYNQRLARIASALTYGSTRSSGNSILQPEPPVLDTSQPVADNSGSNTGASTSSAADSTQADATYDSSTDLQAAMQLYTDGRIDEAQAAFRKIVAKDANAGDAYYNLGVIAEGKGQFKDALDAYQNALRITPDDADLKQTVASVQAKLGSGGAAGGAPSVGAAPSSPGSIWSGSGSSYSGGGSPATAPPISASERSHLKQLVSEASADYKAGSYDNAISKLNQVAAQSPGDADVQYAIAQAYRGKGDLVGALSYMARASSLNPGNATYKSGVTDIQQVIQAQQNAGLAGKTASVPDSSGQITPFANSKATSSNPLSGLARSSSSGNYRIKRAISYGIAGAATSVLASVLLNSRGMKTPGTNHFDFNKLKKAAITGAAVGGLMGLVLGK